MAVLGKGDFMTVQELIRLLQTYPPDLRVVVNGYEDGYDDLSPEQVTPAEISLGTGTHDWEGAHGDARDLNREAAGGVEVVDALVLQRASN